VWQQQEPLICLKLAPFFSSRFLHSRTLERGIFGLSLVLPPFVLLLLLLLSQQKRHQKWRWRPQYLLSAAATFADCVSRLLPLPRL